MARTMSQWPRFGATLQLGEYFVGISLQAVSGENRDGLAKNLVTRGSAAAQVIVIERRQVVMNERIGVQHFQRCAEFFDSFGERAGDHASGFHAENGAQALASGEDAVAHGFVDGAGMLGL